MNLSEPFEWSHDSGESTHLSRECLLPRFGGAGSAGRLVGQASLKVSGEEDGSSFDTVVPTVVDQVVASGEQKVRQDGSGERTHDPRVRVLDPDFHRSS